MDPLVVLIHDFKKSDTNMLVNSVLFPKGAHAKDEARRVGKLVMDAVVVYNNNNPFNKINTLLVPDAAPALYPRNDADGVGKRRNGYITGLLEGRGDENRPVIEISCDNEAKFKEAMEDLKGINTSSEC
eukprot:GHVU01059985.1.p1 GENE.GHVU01059985.1~~GHVU01059985.1.p1  ORF type:complete len:129 (+),score=23.02 GHVU01059985.1:332-718(+)